MGSEPNTVQQLLLSKRGCFDGTAVLCRGVRTSYEEFDRVTDRIALGLQKTGIGPGCFAAVYLDRDERMVEAIFGVLKAGAAVIPMNRDMPEKRMNSLLSACGASIVLNEKNLDELLAGIQEVPDRNAAPTQLPLRLAGEEDPALVLATSGTTGQPKGVCQNQRSLRFLFEQFPYRLGEIGIFPAEYDTVIAHLQQGYIVAYHYEYPSALLNGKKLILLTDEEQFSVRAFCEAAEESRHCLLAMIPSQFAVMLDHNRFRQALSHIASLNFFAEPVSENLKEQLRTLLPETSTVHELYGQTEVFGIGWRDLWDRKPGMRPSPGVQIRLLDEDGAEAAPDEKAQLCVHSPTMFDRYYIDAAAGEADGTESDRQFALKNMRYRGARFVKTGDLGLLTDAARFLLRGRRDRMVKFHGQRIELPEIESVLSSFPGITRAAAVLKRDTAGNAALAAYYTSAAPCDEAALRCYLRQRLSAFMIPSVLIRLDAMPLGNNGKTDYRSLEQRELTAAPAHAEPGSLTEKERLLLSLAADILNLPKQSLTAELSLQAQGMDSLSAILLAAKLCDLGYTMSLEAFLNAPNVRALAAALKKEASERPLESRTSTSPVYPATDMQQTWIRRHFRIVKSFLIPWGIEEETFRIRADGILRNHPALRSVFFGAEDEIFTKVLAAKKAFCEYRDFRTLRPEARRSAVGACLAELYGFPKPESLFYPMAFRLDEEETALVLICDHTAVDGLSEQILLEELISDNASVGDAYIPWLKERNDASNLQKAEDFWRDYLQGAIPAVIPAPGPAHSAAKHLLSGTCSLRFSRAETEALERRSHELEVSVTTLVLYAYGNALLHLLGADKLCFESVVSGRSNPIPGLADTVGCLVSSVPVCISTTDSVKDFMRSCILADRYSGLPRKRIMQAAFGTEEALPMAPHIDSLLFPERSAIRRAAPLYALDYSVFPEGNFLWKSEGELQLCLHFDPQRYDPAFTERLVTYMEAELRRRIREAGL